MTNKVTIKYTGGICPLNQKFMIGKKNIFSKTKNRIVSVPLLFSSKRYSECKEEIGWKAKVQCPQIAFPKEANLSFTLEFWYPRQVDSDAFLKVCRDALIGVVFLDDRQISEDHTKRHISPGIEFTAIITIEELSSPIEGQIKLDL